MNEQIFELAIKCGIIEMDQNGEDNTAAVQEFAELIIRECAKLVEDNIDPENTWITPAHIKEHFGVK